MACDLCFQMFAVVIGERVAYLEEQIMTPDGENIALSRVEEWEVSGLTHTHTHTQ